MSEKRGFTLIELLVVIAIVAVLAVTVILTLNPAELLKQARDSTRMSDLNTLNKAIALYLADARSPYIGSALNCYIAINPDIEGDPDCAGFNNYTSIAPSASVAVDGTGWLPINFTQISSGAPISVLPVDPILDLTYSYAYIPSSQLTYELYAELESSKYSNGGSSDRESTDGGNNPNLYEVGSDPGLDL
jgi:prepilin-type N-terminal cleavage/methylation domain-containing protein